MTEFGLKHAVLHGFEWMRAQLSIMRAVIGAQLDILGELYSHRGLEVFPD